MQTFVYFTYAPDRDKLWESIRATRRHYPDDRIAVLMEAGKEFDEGFQLDLKERYGCEVETTYFDRKRNLNGTACIHGMWRYFERFAQDSERVFKIDSDVIMLKTPPEKSFISAWDNRASGRIIFGMLYGLESTVIHEIWSRWGEFMAIFHKMPKRRMAEDLWMRFALESTGHPHAKLLYEEGAINVWKYRKELDANDLVGPYVINFGFWRHCPDAGKHAQMMKSANEIIENSLDR